MKNGDYMVHVSNTYSNLLGIYLARQELHPRRWQNRQPLDRGELFEKQIVLNRKDRSRLRVPERSKLERAPIFWV